MLNSKSNEKRSIQCNMNPMVRLLTRFSGTRERLRVVREGFSMSRISAHLGSICSATNRRSADVSEPTCCTHIHTHTHTHTQAHTHTHMHAQVSFCSLIKGITPKICRLCTVPINSILLNLLCVWIWNQISRPFAFIITSFVSVAWKNLRWCLCARKSRYALYPISQKFPHCCLWNSSNVRLTDGGHVHLFCDTCPIIVLKITVLFNLLCAATLLWSYSKSWKKQASS